MVSRTKGVSIHAILTDEIAYEIFKLDFKDWSIYRGVGTAQAVSADPLHATKAKIICKGDILSSYTVTSKTAEIKQLLCPIALKDVRTLPCLGLNYEQFLFHGGGLM
jgi:hypothetical protein